MKTLPNIDRRAWLALWAQKRRRARHAPSAPPAPQLLDGLWAYWTMDEPGGQTRLDSFWNGYDLEEWSFAEFEDSVPHVPVPSCSGVIGNAAQFYFGPGLGLLASADNTLPDGDFTFAGWFSYNSSTGYDGQGLISLGGSVWMGIRAYDGAVNFGVNLAGGGVETTTPAGSVLEDDWTHVAFVRHGGSLEIYLNGVLRAATSFAGPVLVTPAAYFGGTEILVGVNPWGYPLIGTVDELGCWERALAAAEVGQLYNYGDGLPFENF